MNGVSLRAESEFAPGVGCNPCKTAGHFCQAHDYNDADVPACKKCLAGELCGTMMARDRSAADLNGPDLLPAPAPRAEVMCVHGCGKRRHRGTCSAARRARFPLAIQTPRSADPAARAGIDRALPPAELPVAKVDPRPELIPAIEPSKAAQDDDMGKVVDVASIPVSGPIPDGSLLRKAEHAMSLPSGKGLGWDRPTKHEAKLLYDKLRKFVRHRRMPLKARITGLSVFLWKVDR